MVRRRGENLPWIRNTTLIPQRLIVVAITALFLFQIAMLAAPISVCFGEVVIERKRDENVRAKNNQ